MQQSGPLLLTYATTQETTSRIMPPKGPRENISRVYIPKPTYVSHVTTTIMTNISLLHIKNDFHHSYYLCH